MKIKPIHLQAFFIWLIYTIITKGTFAEGMTKSIRGFDAYLLNIFFSVFFGVLFLYFFSHEDFFKFAREIERKNSKKERQWEHRLFHYGKFFSTIVIGAMSGPLIGALAVRFLISKSKYKYVIIGISSAISATLWLGIARGIIPLRLPF